MKKYDKLLHPPRAGVYAAPRLAGPLRAAAKQAGLAWLDLDLEGVRDRDGLLARCAAVFRLPAYFGHNWDAFHECLVELAGGSAPGAVVHWRRGAALAKQSPQAVETALEILEEAGMYWARSGRAFLVLVDRDSAGGRALPPLR